MRYAALLCLIPLAALGQPKPSVTPHLALTPRSAEVAFTWDNHPTNWVQLGISNRVYAWTNASIKYFQDVGQTNFATATQPVNVRMFYHVRAVLNEVESEPSNTIGNPPKTIGIVYWQKNGQDQGVLETWTNAPPDDIVLYRLRTAVYQSYEP